MAVLINNMDMPENCGACVLRDKCGVLYFGSRYVDYTERDPDCPLKSTDEMCNEIQNIYVGYRHGYEVMADVMDIINKYCKENTNDKRNA